MHLRMATSSAPDSFNILKERSISENLASPVKNMTGFLVLQFFEVTGYM